uniref:Uncharacterized protein n=1 Tax=Pan troglodytes TaxID=9598 RepID=A0A2I3TCY9_PANTR
MREPQPDPSPGRLPYPEAWGMVGSTGAQIWLVDRSTWRVGELLKKTSLSTSLSADSDSIKEYLLQVWWLTPVIPALWEAEVDGPRGQEFKTSLANMVKPPSLLQIQKKLAGRGSGRL